MKKAVAILIIIMMAAAAFASLAVQAEEPAKYVHITASANDPYANVNFSPDGNHTEIDPDVVKWAAVKYRTVTEVDDTGVQLIGQFYINPAAEPFIPVKYDHTRKWETLVVDLTGVSQKTSLSSIWDGGHYTSKGAIRFDPLESNRDAEANEAGSDAAKVSEGDSIDIAWIAFFENEDDAKSYDGTQNTPYCIITPEELSQMPSAAGANGIASAVIVEGKENAAPDNTETKAADPLPAANPKTTDASVVAVAALACVALAGVITTVAKKEIKADKIMKRVITLLIIVAVTLSFASCAMRFPRFRFPFFDFTIGESDDTESSTAENNENDGVVEVKDVVGMTQNTARDILEAQGFKVRIRETPDDRIKAGDVIIQSPGAGTLQEKGAEIVLIISSGTGDTEEVTGKTVSAPDVSLSDTDISQGGIIGILVKNASSSGITAETQPDMGVNIVFYDDDDGNTFAYLPTSYETNPGGYTLRLVYNSVMYEQTINVCEVKFNSKTYTESESVIKSVFSQENKAAEEDLHASVFSSPTSRTLLCAGETIGYPTKRSDHKTGYGLYMAFKSTGEEARHDGVDYDVQKGSEIKAAYSGTVVYVGSTGIHGGTIVIDHGRGVRTWYCRVDTSLVKVGQTVAKGDVIARSDDSGFGDRRRVHFGVSVGRIFVNPIQLYENGLPE